MYRQLVSDNGINNGADHGSDDEGMRGLSSFEECRENIFHRTLEHIDRLLHDEGLLQTWKDTPSTSTSGVLPFGSPGPRNWTPSQIATFHSQSPIKLARNSYKDLSIQSAHNQQLISVPFYRLWSLLSFWFCCDAGTVTMTSSQLNQGNNYVMLPLHLMVFFYRFINRNLLHTTLILPIA